MKKIERWGLYSVIGLSILFVFMFIYIACMRINYPYELEWMEGGVLQEIQQILSGGKLYVEPSLTFTPYIYGPVYFYVASVFVSFFGENFFSMRLVSFLATIGVFAIIYLTIKKETNQHSSALLAVGLFASTYSLCGYWFDLARVDMLFLFLLISGIYFIRFFENKWLWIFGSSLLVLSIFTKQTSAFVVGAFLVALLIKERKKGSILTVVIGALGVIGNAIMKGMYGKWYSYYLFDLPKHHALQWGMSVTFWMQQIGVLFILFGLVIYVLWKMKKEKNEHFVYYVCLFLSTFFISWSSLIHSGGYINVVIPAYYSLALLGGYILYYAKDYAIIRPLFIYGAIVSQFLFLVINPLKPYEIKEHIPNAAQTKNIKKIEKEIKQTKGTLFAPSFSYLTNDKQVQAMAIIDIYRAKGNVEKKVTLEKTLQEKIKRQSYTKLVLTSNDMIWIKKVVPNLHNYYQRTEKINIPEKYAIDGMEIRSYNIYVPKKER